MLRQNPLQGKQLTQLLNVAQRLVNAGRPMPQALSTTLATEYMSCVTQFFVRNAV